MKPVLMSTFMVGTSLMGQGNQPNQGGEVQLALLQTQPRSLDMSAGPNTLHVEPKAQSGLALRGAWAWPLVCGCLTGLPVPDQGQP